ncbi:MAG: NAD(P)-dependent glycerol-3-phosphate dehydrogenase [Coriobacteriales bacterium]|nr:NAD(P)-dependent glycerol-3-phosphate dehydrogenase [Coriobacteriales bacterium]
MAVASLAPSSEVVACLPPPVSVIGAGSWGSAIAWLLGQKGVPVSLWARDTSLVNHFNSTSRNPRYLKEIVFPDVVTATTDLMQAVSNAKALILVTPSVAVAGIAQQLKPLIAYDTPLIILSKGLDPDSGQLLDRVLTETIGNSQRIAVLSGPNHAEEICLGIPAGTVVASASEPCAAFFQKLLATPAFRVYVSNDVVGVQLCGAAKNVIAIACGVSAGLGLGDNTQAMLMTRGLAEIARLVEAAGGSPITGMGLAGMGDLIATCTSPHSRNRGFGLELANGGNLESYQAHTHMVVEGAIAARTITALAKKHSVEMPICEQVRSVVWEDQPVEQAFQSLISREFKPEFY